MQEIIYDYLKRFKLVEIFFSDYTILSIGDDSHIQWQITDNFIDCIIDGDNIAYNLQYIVKIEGYGEK